MGSTVWAAASAVGVHVCCNIRPRSHKHMYMYTSTAMAIKVGLFANIHTLCSAECSVCFVQHCRHSTTTLQHVTGASCVHLIGRAIQVWLYVQQCILAERGHGKRTPLPL